MKRPVVIALLALCGLSCGCRDRFDVPDTPADAPAANITIASLHAFLHAETVVVREELTVSGTVVSSDEAGNFYRTLVLDDGTGGAELRIAEYNLYTICPPGCRLTVSLRGCALGERNGVLQIGLPPDAYSPYPTGYISSRVLLERLLSPTINHRPRHALSKALFAVLFKHARNLFFAGAGNPGGCTHATRRVHTHIQRPIFHEAKAAFRVIQLRRGHAQIEQNAVKLSSQITGLQLCAQFSKTALHNDKAAILGR